MKEKIYVSIFEEKMDGRVDKMDVEVDSLLTAVRLILTYKPKKGNRVVNITIDFMEVLV